MYRSNNVFMSPIIISFVKYKTNPIKRLVIRILINSFFFSYNSFPISRRRGSKNNHLVKILFTYLNLTIRKKHTKMNYLMSSSRLYYQKHQ